MERRNEVLRLMHSRERVDAEVDGKTSRRRRSSR